MPGSPSLGEECSFHLGQRARPALFHSMQQFCIVKPSVVPPFYGSHAAITQ